MKQSDDQNRFQIIRKDAHSCFVESKNDSFSIGKAHLEFMVYDLKKPAGSRQTNHVHIYIDMAEFLCLVEEALSGNLHNRMQRVKALMTELERIPDAEKQKLANAPLYESLGGTPADRLKQPRPDGKSLSRSVKLFVGKKVEYLLCAESGPGRTDVKGLIVPEYGGKPEQKVSVALTWRNLTQLLLMTKIHYTAWLSAQYANSDSVAWQPYPERKENGTEIGNNNADDTQMF